MSLISKRPCFFYGHKNGVQRLAIDNKICKGNYQTEINRIAVQATKARECWKVVYT